MLALVVTMVNLGFWQLRRLDEKKDRNRRITSRSAEPVRPIEQVLTAKSSFADATKVEFRRVTMTGRFRPDQELLVRSRSLDDAPGSWVLTPLLMADGTGSWSTVVGSPTGACSTPCRRSSELHRAR